MQIESESQFILRQLGLILKLPFVLVLALIGKRRFSEVFLPLTNMVRFYAQPRATLLIFAAVTAVWIYQLFYMTEQQLNNLIFRPENLWNLQAMPIVASWFLHGSWTHYLGNMLFLYVFGRIVEKRLGSSMMLFVYFGSAIISTGISAMLGEGGIGASGAIAGLISTAILVDPFYVTYVIIGMPAPVFLVGWLAMLADITGVLVPKNDNIGHFAHLGGYLAVGVLFFLFSRKDRQRAIRGFMVNIAMLIIVVAAYCLLQQGFLKWPSIW
ncbi:MAG: rhomboid family intramembrane serine protease [Candidatus Woesearchaeota archaeon]